jgi:uncharacterized membrane protein (UPF0127 family)
VNFSQIAICKPTNEKLVFPCIKTDSFMDRMLGLMKIEDLSQNQVLWINPCNAVHTFRMKHNLDLIYLSKANKVTKIVKDIAPSKFSMCWRAHSVIETKTGFTNRFSIAEGDLVACID